MHTRTGGLKASADQQGAGERYNSSAKGVYFHALSTLAKVLEYARFAPVFNDGTFCRAYIKCRVDRAHRVKYPHRTKKSRRLMQTVDLGKMGIARVGRASSTSPFSSSTWPTSNWPLAMSSHLYGTPPWRRDHSTLSKSTERIAMT